MFADAYRAAVVVAEDAIGVAEEEWGLTRKTSRLR
jgi:hypothetical protein